MSLGMRTTVVHGLLPEGPAVDEATSGDKQGTPASPSDCRQPRLGCGNTDLCFIFLNLILQTFSNVRKFAKLM